MSTNPDDSSSVRRRELLAIAAELFAERGFFNTTVREIGDAAGILSGSLYHHFGSKEEMVDSILREFLQPLQQRFAALEADASLDSKELLGALVHESFDAMDNHYQAVLIFKHDGRRLSQFPRFSYLLEVGDFFEGLWMRTLRRGLTEGVVRPDLDLDLLYRLLRDVVWDVAAWYNPGDDPDYVARLAQQYTTILFEGLCPEGARGARRAAVVVPAS